MAKLGFDLPRKACTNPECSPAIIFIHGLGGKAASTWKDMLTCFNGDAAFAGYTLDCYAYPTKLLRLPFMTPPPGLRSLAEGLRTYIEEQHGEKSSISLVAHSLGGLIARQHIVAELKAKRDLRIKKLALISVPNNGAALANVGRLISFPNRQLITLARDDDALLSLNLDWQQLNVEDSLPVRYIAGGCDRVVPLESASPSLDPDKNALVIEADHRSIIRPNGTDDLRYTTLRRFLKQPLSTNTSSADAATTSLSRAERRSADILFDAYTPSDRPYYEVRAIDRLISEAFGNGNIWLNGPSGVGKTAALRRAVFQSGWELNHINLAGYEITSPLELFKALAHEIAAIAGLSERIKSDSDVGQCSAFLKEVLRKFPSEVMVANVIEELPVTEQVLAQFADLMGGFLENVAMDASLSKRTAFAFSSIVPLEGIKAKTREKIQLMGMGPWSSSEALKLVEMLSGALWPELTAHQHLEIVEAASGSPRFIKHLFRTWRNKASGKLGLADLLIQTRQELAQ